MKVFLSSTAQDLVAHRQVADDTILRLSQQSVVMERFGPLPGTPVAECERLARESDVVVCIVAHRYGFVPEKGEGSITRREVEAAQAAGREVLVFLIADDYPWTEKKEQDLLADQAAREALDLAADPECRYAWGEADAAQVWGEAFFANHDPTPAKRAFTRALEVRKRIEHPGVGETERWLGLVG
jgi:hypothetical protein